jgi:adenylylsulfate kinase
MTRILIMGLPGAGKTMLASALREKLWSEGRTVSWFNADEVRKNNNDWDFSAAGRIRQSVRMRDMADAATTDYVICDFVAPLTEMRDNFQADCTVWVDTIEAGRFDDTNTVFSAPEQYDFRVTEQDCEKWAEIIGQHLLDHL